MKMIRKSFAFTATALPILAFALTSSAASAQSFTGNYISGVRDPDAVWHRWQHQMRQLKLLPEADRRWQLRSAEQRPGHAGELQ